MTASPAKNWLTKAWWKYTDPPQYQLYKERLAYYQSYQGLKKFESENRHTTMGEILGKLSGAAAINVSHTGNAGDVIYSLPVVRKLCEITGVPVNFLLKINEPLRLMPGMSHPLGNVMLNMEMAESLISLLNFQSYIARAAIYSGQDVHLDLSAFRQSGLELDRGNIARWYFYVTGINADLSEPWLGAEARSEFSDAIIIARSNRYNNPLVDYSFLSGYSNLVFVGIRAEYERMKRSIENLYWHPVTNFLELAQVIKGGKLFIGNQSFPFSVAEGLKVLRILEVYHRIPNVIPEGRNGYDFYFQKHFEYLVDSLVSARDPEPAA
ncbi:MAG TPA: hypothetical protein VHC47_08670 [Mucilaginibacter sp.]|nr:hypothetical protein [Mucilaginibacter sp.]